MNIIDIIGIVGLSILVLGVTGGPVYLLWWSAKQNKLDEQHRAAKKARKKEKKRRKKTALANSQAESPSASIYPSNPQ